MAAQEDCCQLCTEVIAEYGLSDSCEHYFCYACLFKWCSTVPKGTAEAVANKSCPLCKRSIHKILKSKTLIAHNSKEKNRKISKICPLDRDQQFKKLVARNWKEEYVAGLLEVANDILTDLQASGIEVDIAILRDVDEVRVLQEEDTNNSSVVPPDNEQTDQTDSANESNVGSNNEDCYARLVHLVNSILTRIIRLYSR